MSMFNVVSHKLVTAVEGICIAYDDPDEDE